MAKFQRATLAGAGAQVPLLCSLSVLALALCMSAASRADDAAPAAAPDPPKAAVPAPPASPVEVIYSGFSRHADRGASVFVRLTGEVMVGLTQHGQQLTYRLNGARLAAPNNANPLLTEHFGLPVSRISLVQVKEGVDLVIELSQASANADPAAYRLVLRDGLATLQVDLPPPSGS